MNLLKETIEDIHRFGKSLSDISFIGSSIKDINISWEQFLILANKEYDNGYGSQEVSKDLIIVFNDGSYMDRSEYDGSEWWSYRKVREKPHPSSPNAFNIFTGREGIR